MISPVYCPFCASPRRPEVEEEITYGDLGWREIALRYKTSLRAVERHASHIDQWSQPEPTTKGHVHEEQLH